MFQAPNTLFLYLFWVITWLAFLFILNLFTEDAVLHSKSVLLPETTHSCLSFLPTSVPVHAHNNCPLRWFFSWVAFQLVYILVQTHQQAWTSCKFYTEMNYKAGRNEKKKTCIVLLLLSNLWHWLTTSWFWTTQTFHNASSINLLPMCYLWFAQIIYSARSLFLVAFFPRDHFRMGCRSVDFPAVASLLC